MGKWIFQSEYEEENLPPQLFQIYSKQIEDLSALKKKYGAVVSPEELIEAAEA